MDVQIKHLSKTYPGQKRPAVDDVSFRLEKGSMMALVGESGSGKTTLLRLLAGLERPDGGEIIINGQVVAAQDQLIPPHKRRIGMVFQDFALFPHLNLLDNIGYALKGLSSSQKVKKVEELLHLTGLSEPWTKYPGQLSGGQQQRVALARALASNPDILLLDEPFSSLDAVLKEQIREEIRIIIKQAGITALLVTHDTKDALATADQVAVMAAGKLLQAGSVQEVYWQPSEPYVAALFGKYNQVKGRFNTTNRRWDTAFGELCIPVHVRQPRSMDEDLYFRPSQVDLDVLDLTRAIGSGFVEQSYYAGDHWEIQLVGTKDFEQRIWVYSKTPPPMVGSEVQFQLSGLCHPK
jgi:iron(III) transport system ATP-binding protein